MLKFQNENAVLNYLGVRREVTVSYTIKEKIKATPDEIKGIKETLKAYGATNIKVK